MIGTILVVIVIAIVVVLWLLFVILSFSGIYLYKKATRTDAVVVDDLGELRLSTGNHTIGVPRYRTFHKYKVSINIDAQKLVLEAELKNRKLKVGEHVEVRYYFDKDGNIKLATEALMYWAVEMVIGYTLGIIVGIVLLIIL